MIYDQLFNCLSTWHMSDGAIISTFLCLCKFQGIWGDGFELGHIKDFHRSWSGSLANRRLCLGPTRVINCTSLSASSFWASLFPRMHGCNKLVAKLRTKIQNGVKIEDIKVCRTQEYHFWEGNLYHLRQKKKEIS